MASPRVLHIIDPGTFDAPSACGPCTLRQAADLIDHLPHIGHDVLVLGTRQDVQLARQCGLEVDAAFCPPRMLPLSGRWSLARLIDSLQERRGKYTVAHGWSPRAALLASVLLPRVERLCSLNVGHVHRFSKRALRTLLVQHQASVILANELVGDACRAAGLMVNRAATIAPAVDERAINQRTRALLREKWNVDDDTMLIGAMCEPACASDARIAIRVITSLRLTGRKVRMVISGDATRRVDARWWGKRLGSDQLLIFSDAAAQPWRIAPALDAAWLMAAAESSMVRPVSTLPLLWAMTAGLPIVAEARGAAQQLIDDEVHGLLVPPAQIPDILDRLARVYDDRAWGCTLGQAAQLRVQDIASMERYGRQMATLYHADHPSGPPQRDLAPAGAPDSAAPLS